MATPNYENEIATAHEASVNLSWMSQDSQATQPPLAESYATYVDAAQVVARNAVFVALGGGLRATGDQAVKGVEALLYATGRDRSTAQTMAERFATIASPTALSEAPQAVYITGADVRLNTVGLVVGNHMLAAARLETSKIKGEPSIFDRFAEIIIPYDDTNFFEYAKTPGWFINHPIIDRPQRLDIRKTSIFDDPEEAAAHAKEHSTPYLLVGNTAVSAMLAARGTQDALAVKALLERDSSRGRQPLNLEGIDLPAAAETGMLALIDDSAYHALPAQAHGDILSEMRADEIAQAAQRAIANVPTEVVAQSDRLTYLRLNRKLDASLDKITEAVVRNYVMNLSKRDAKPYYGGKNGAQSIQTALKKKLALSLEAQLEYNHYYKHAFTGGLGRAIQRRRVKAAMAAAETDD